MAFGTSGPDATDSPANIHTTAAATTAMNLLAACMTPPWFPCPDPYVVL